jgi:nucleoside-diphosphate-sugar epimerase
MKIRYNSSDESTPYFPLEQHTDEYSRTKAMAEQMVLNANNTKLKNNSTFHTCAIRPAAIYGEGEERHFPRLYCT